MFPRTQVVPRPHRTEPLAAGVEGAREDEGALGWGGARFEGLPGLV